MRCSPRPANSALLPPLQEFSLHKITGVKTGQSLTGMKIDPTTGAFYVVGTDGNSSTLYTLNTATGALAEIGTQSTAAALIELAINENGDMYGTNVIENSLFSINKTNGAATLIGLLGFDIASAQGMDFDYESGILYAGLTWYDNSPSQSNFARIDLTTGAATQIAYLDRQELEIAINSPAGSVIPEPTSLLLLGSGLGVIGLAAWRRRK